MAARKRKSPDKKKPVRKQKGLLTRAGLGFLHLLARHPGKIGGTLTVCLAFSCVAANAIWYQPERHPSPFLRTRDPGNFNAMPGFNPFAERKGHLGDVTTFRIERQNTDTPNPPATAVATASQPGTDTKLVSDTQSELQRLGLYNGPTDGLNNPALSSAISRYQQRIGLPATGEASRDLLAAMSLDQAAASIVPKERPSSMEIADKTDTRNTSSSMAASQADPIAAAIRNAEKTLPTPTPVSAQWQNTSPPVLDAANADPAMISAIQRGLSHIAYSDLDSPGVYGQKTKAAILHFQRHYHLPVDGQPSPIVLKKLKSIGAL
ncbi:peptidoglycan-binding protein [Allorhizobium sp. BGMRC 0089]|uniref:peptidoglycan-binding domain-containing protein n=1 Tax=Allorhizobium sonneratiae TaxID=2934936 RepID=UPI0020343186|nr:peptidoglycan-binding domain-containing protein [Allorhizobium sonneratiae]MCM2293506.1 peptidoglycan-binding protein [Allorhizobium sonneratiae]